MISILHGLSIRALSSALPSRRLTLDDFSALFGARESVRIAKSTGIDSVRIAGDLTSVDLAAAATHNLFSNADINPNSIDALVLVTQTPDSLMPASSALLAARLRLKKNIAAFDLNFGCSGYIYGLYQAAMLVSAGGCRRVLLCTSDVISKLLRPHHHHVRMVFGDAASATLVEAGSHSFSFSFSTDGKGAAYLNTPLNYLVESSCSAEIGSLFMDGAQVMNFALEKVPAAILGFLEELQIDVSSVPFFLLHQANAFMLQYLGKNSVSPKNAFLCKWQKPAIPARPRIPVLLSTSPHAQQLCRDNLVTCGFGVGLSIGVAHISLGNTQLIPPVDSEQPQTLGKNA